jgi:hypothetical protein
MLTALHFLRQKPSKKSHTPVVTIFPGPKNSHVSDNHDITSMEC